MEEIEEIDTSDILTFDELLEDDYYRSEFEKRLQQELDIKISHSDVKGGGKIMDNVQKVDEETNAAQSAPVQEVTPSSAPTKPEKAPTDNPTAKPTDAETHSDAKPPEKPNQSDEVMGLKAELALIKAGIIPERLEAAKKLFLAEGGDETKAAEFVEKYPEWKSGAGTGISLHKAPPVTSKTAPNPLNAPVLNDFEKRVAAMRKKVGLN